MYPLRRTAPVGVLLAALALLSACGSPLQRDAATDLRRSIVDAAERELREARTNPDPKPLERQPSTLDFGPERRAELDRMGGVGSYAGVLPPLGPDLVGRAAGDTPAVRVSLQQAVAAAVKNNLDVQIARVDPAVAQAQVVAAEAAFDWLFFANLNWANTDEPGRVPIVNGLPVGAGASGAQSVAYTTGLRKPLTSGGAFQASQGQTYTDATTGANFDPDPGNAAFVSLRFEQPLLRGFGSDVNLADVRLTRNLERAAIADLETTLLDTVTDVERAYWNLLQARLALQVRQRLLERGIETRDVLESRRGVDARPAEISDAVARVESRRADVIRAVNALRQASDRLKLLINDPELTVGSETLLVPTETLIESPIVFSLAESIATGLAARPELARAVLAIDDASIRAAVARNARLPLLNLALESTLRGLDSDAAEAYDDIVETQYVSYLLDLAFEQPIGNRAAEAQFRRRQLERLRATLGFRRTAQAVVFDVKTALRDVRTNYKLIQQTRTARVAATENLRTLQVLEDTIASLTPDFLDLKFNRQEALAGAELEELGALVDYNIALAGLQRATGAALERNGVRLVVPDAGVLLSGDPEPQP